MADADTRPPINTIARLVRLRDLVARIRAREPDMTDRQKAVLMLICLTEGPHRTRGLARTLDVGKPIITRAMNTLGSLGFLRRQVDQNDRRECLAVPTAAGRAFVERMG